jgi:hypothetical protein
MSNDKKQDQDGKGMSDDHRNDEVKITVNNKSVPIHRGRQTVEAIKRAGGVPLADQLEQIIDGKLVPLPDDGSVVIKGGEEFKSHPPSGGAS